MDQEHHLAIDPRRAALGQQTGPHLLALIDAPDPHDSSLMQLMEAFMSHANGWLAIDPTPWPGASCEQVNRTWATDL
jgi:hypothetical protein